MSSIFKRVFIGAFIFTTLSSSFAGFWEAITPYRGPKRDVITLIITANYKHPLVIAQLLQDETKQPYLLLPAANGKGIFFNPPRERSEAALEIREVNLARFIRFLNPKQIVILGDDRYVAEKYRKMIDKNTPVIAIHCDNWQLIADRVSILLDASNVGDDYKKLGYQLNSSLYKPTKLKEFKSDAPVPVKDIVIDDIVIDKKVDADVAKKDTKDVKETAAPKKTDIKEPELNMPKDTPKLIKDK
jgi:hypothetical protein